jgi:hypothetical protein
VALKIRRPGGLRVAEALSVPLAHNVRPCTQGDDSAAVAGANPWITRSERTRRTAPQPCDRWPSRKWSDYRYSRRAKPARPRFTQQTLRRPPITRLTSRATPNGYTGSGINGLCGLA